MSAQPTIIRVDAQAPDPLILVRGVDSLRAGGLVAVPTETYYGLAVDPWNPLALEKLFAAKGRPQNAPILLLLAGTDQIPAVAAITPTAARLAARFWPGPLTLVLPALPHVSSRLTGGGATIGLRVPGLALPRAMALALGRPITGTSANASGAPPTASADGLPDAMGDRFASVDLVLDGGATPGGMPSTVVDLCGTSPRAIREGAIPFEAILRALDR